MEKQPDDVELLAVIDKRLEVFKSLHAALAESESILSKALFQAHQRLDVVAEAWRAQFSVEDLVRFARLISASHAAQAPPGWALGDPRRPYPSDDQMKDSILRRLPEVPLTSTAVLPDKEKLKPSLSRSLSSPQQQSVAQSTSSIAVNPALQLLATTYEQEIANFSLRPSEANGSAPNNNVLD